MRFLGEQELIDFFTANVVPGECARAFRVEYLSAYTVGSDGGDYQRWLAGELEPTWERKNAVIKGIRDKTAGGLTTERVKVVANPRTDYDRYACEWGYAYNSQAGEVVNIWDLADRPLPTGIVDHDFWLLDDDRVIAMHYDEHGRFEGGSLPDSRELIGYLRTREILRDGSQPFETWWPAHPELLRTRRAA